MYVYDVGSVTSLFRRVIYKQIMRFIFASSDFPFLFVIHILHVSTLIASMLLLLADLVCRIMGNPSAFEGKVVLDVGTGSGILAIWAAKVRVRSQDKRIYHR